MANKKITDLTLRSDFDETCNLPVDDTAQTWRTTGQQVKDFILNGLAYWQGYHDSAGSVIWNTTSNTPADFTVVSGTANLEELISDGLSVATAASDLPGITFTPIDGALYRIKAKTIIQLTGVTGNIAGGLQLWDGSMQLSDSQVYTPASVGALQEMHNEALWVAPDASPVTMSLRGFVGGDPGYLLGIGYTTNYIEWIVQQLR